LPVGFGLEAMQCAGRRNRPDLTMASVLSMHLPGKQRLRYGVALPAMAQALAGGISSWLMILCLQKDPNSTEVSMVIPLVGLPSAFVVGLVLDGVLSLFHWNSRGWLFITSVMIGLLPLLALGVWMMAGSPHP
jgi:hypothetical protein